MLKKSNVAVTVLGIALAAGVFSGTNAKADEVIGDPKLSVRIEDPADFVSDPNLKIGFVALDIEAVNGVEAKCFEETFGEFDSFTFGPGGDSADCQVDSSVMSASGTYRFYVTADAGSGINRTASVQVEFDNRIPGTPVDYDRDGDSCNVSFKSADDGITEKVELHRSKDRKFTASASTLVNTVSVLPNSNGSMSDPNGNCDDYLYAIRAVSAAGAYSGFVGDEEEETETETRTRTVVISDGSAGGAIPAVGGGTVGADGTVEGEEIEVVGGQDGEGGEGSVLGEQTEGDGLSGILGLLGRSWPWALIILGIILGWYYGTFRRRKTEGGQS